MWKSANREPDMDGISSIGSLRIQANCLIHSPGEPGGLDLRGESQTIFNGDAWESEIVWQIVQILIDDMGSGKLEVKEALHEAIRNLDAMP